ncbi:hypothetical protein [Shouchella miscanthi]|uniref:Phage protein n=1 Tax=Shouchella miscanthi TaxID=2598861 RepID=A0ABU6NRD0_9BACI|nr:hypothetical protein [Shouchella miscanthi]
MIDLENGIPIPESLTAIYDKEAMKLYVHEPTIFEKMLYSHEASREKANTNLLNFKKGQYKIGKEEYKVKGLEFVESEILKSTRCINRIARFDASEQSSPIEKIQDAISKLKSDQQIDIDHSKKEIHVQEGKHKTFVAIIHNSIIERLITGEVEVL